MGGNALKNCVTRRYDSEDYYELENEVLEKLGTVLGVHCTPIKAYAYKAGFGDMDIIVQSDYLPVDWIFLLKHEFCPKEVFENGNCFSFEYKEFQIDLILTPIEHYETSLNYFAYNDLGNLLGRVAHRMGMKFGHDGLTYDYKVSPTVFVKNIPLLTDFKEILEVLGYSHDRYMSGFNTLEDIFKFVVSSKFFTKDIYTLENRNHVSRVRDAKRKTYTDFLAWLETIPEPVETLNADLQYLFDKIPGFKEQYEQTKFEVELNEKFKVLFNGNLVSKWTGLTGKELGDFMRSLREGYGEERLKKDVIAMNPTLIEGWVKYFYNNWKV